MKKIIFTLFMFLLTTTANAALVLYDNCETDQTTTLWLKDLDGGTGTIGPSTDYKLAGLKSYKVYHPAQPTSPHVELRYNPHITWGDDWWFGYAFYIPNSWQLPTKEAVVGQFHRTPHNSAGVNFGTPDCDVCPEFAKPWQPIMFNIQGTVDVPVYRARGGSSSIYCMAYGTPCSFHDYENWIHSFTGLAKETWIPVVINYRPSYDDDGYLSIWVNGVQLVRNGKNTYNDNLAPFFRIGIYTSSALAHTIYLDEIRIGKNSSYSEVYPGGTTPHIPPTVIIDSPVGNQSINAGDSLNFACTRTLGDGTSWTNMVWDFGGSGISQSTSEDPGSKQFNNEGNFTIYACATDNNDLSDCDSINVDVGTPPAISGLVNRYEFESGSITTDSEGNENLINNGTIVNEGAGTEPDPPGYGSIGVDLNGTSQYFSVAAYDATNPWQTGQSDGTFIVAIKPSSFGQNRFYASRWSSAASGKTIGLLSYSNGAPGIMIGDGDSVEYFWMTQQMIAGNKYILGFQVSDSDKSYRVECYDVTNGQWFPPLSGTYTDSMYLSGTAAWNIGRISTGSYYYSGTIYWARTYNEGLSSAEIREIILNEAPSPPSSGVTVNTGGGTPYLEVETGASDLHLNYLSGSGSSILVWRGTVTAGMASVTALVKTANGIVQNGGTFSGNGSIARVWCAQYNHWFKEGDDITVYTEFSGSDPVSLTLPTEGQYGSLSYMSPVYIDTTQDTISTMCFSNSSGTCVSQNTVVKRGELACVTLTMSSSTPFWGENNISNIVLPFTLNGTGSLNMLYASGAGTNSIVMCDIVDSGDFGNSNLTLSTVNDMDLDYLNIGTDSYFIDSAGNRLSSKAVPQVTADPTYTIQIDGRAKMRQSSGAGAIAIDRAGSGSIVTN